MALTKYPIEIVEKNNIVLKVDNSTLKQFVENEKENLLLYLRSNLENDYIQLKVELIEKSESTVKHQTSREKLKLMIEKNKNILDLIKRFDLNVDD